jgi:hypothetical protein
VPVTSTDEIVAALAPALVTVTVTGVEVVAVRTPPKLMLAGDAVTWIGGAVPVPVNVTVRVMLLFEPVAVITQVSVAATCGWKSTLNSNGTSGMQLSSTGCCVQIMPGWQVVTDMHALLAVPLSAVVTVKSAQLYVSVTVSTTEVDGASSSIWNDITPDVLPTCVFGNVALDVPVG